MNENMKEHIVNLLVNYDDPLMQECCVFLKNNELIIDVRTTLEIEHLRGIYRRRFEMYKKRTDKVITIEGFDNLMMQLEKYTGSEASIVSIVTPFETYMLFITPQIDYIIGIIKLIQHGLVFPDA